jgi:hypothetical protein
MKQPAGCTDTSTGKTSALRVIALAAALDPLVQLYVYELKGTGDLPRGGVPPPVPLRSRRGPGIEATIAGLREIVNTELNRRADVIKGLPKDNCPDSKITPELAANKSLGLRPALGIMLVLATQRPVAKLLPPGISANIGIRFCLREMDQTANKLTEILHHHLAEFRTDEAGRLFWAERDGDLPAVTYQTMWRKVREQAFGKAMAQKSQLAKRPYDLRHAAVLT